MCVILYTSVITLFDNNLCYSYNTIILEKKKLLLKL